MPTVHLNGVDLYYESRGSGDVLLLIPGLGADVADYRKVIDGLARHLCVIALDNRGSGRSDKPDTPYTIEIMADDAAALLGVVAPGAVHVLGHSMGGRVAMDLALRHPECVKSLLLVSTNARAPPETRRRVEFLGALSRRNPLLQRLDQHPQPYYAFLRQLDASRSYDATSRLSEIRVPTLILQGARDRLAPLALAQEMRSRIAGSRLVTLRGGHLVLFMQPDASVQAILDFVRGIGATRGSENPAPRTG